LTTQQSTISKNFIGIKLTGSAILMTTSELQISDFLKKLGILLFRNDLGLLFIFYLQQQHHRILEAVAYLIFMNQTKVGLTHQKKVSLPYHW